MGVLQVGSKDTLRFFIEVYQYTEAMKVTDSKHHSATDTTLVSFFFNDLYFGYQYIGSMDNHREKVQEHCRVCVEIVNSPEESEMEHYISA